jgi:menaquinone-specific isochorismate synthase
MPPRNRFFTFEEAGCRMRSLIADYKPSKSVERIEIKVRPVDMLAWLAAQKNDVKIYGSNQSGTMAIAGIGQAVCVTGKQLGSFKKVFQKLRFFLTPKYPYLQWYGGFCFDDRHQGKEWKEFGAYRFVLPRFELAAQEGRMIFCCNLVGNENIGKILRQLDMVVLPVSSGPGSAWCSRAPLGVWQPYQRPGSWFPSRDDLSSCRALVKHQSSPPDDTRRIDNPSRELWQKNISKVLSDDSVKKVVLARKTSLYFKHAPDPWAMMRHLKTVTPNSYHFAFQFKEEVFLGASPERLFRRHQRFIESEAIAGTVPKSTNPKILKNSDKNKREHAMVVDAINSAFEKFCLQFKRQKRPGILTLANGHHLITKFQGQLKDGINDEDILQFLHPTPALGGTPREQALGLIRRLEGFARGWYGAPIGYVGWDWAQFVVGIRSGLVKGKKLSIFAGAGIVQGSQTSDEWKEVENKISNFIKIIR